MSETGSSACVTRSGATWLEGLSERQKILATLCAMKADDAQLLEALARLMEHYTPLEKPWCFLAIEALLPPSAFWRAFHLFWPSFEQPPHGRFLWSLGRRRTDWHLDYMAPEDAATFAALPETLRLYGTRDDWTRIALSWRLNENASDKSRSESVSVEATAQRAAVAGVFASGAETEIVLFSCKDLAARR